MNTRSLAIALLALLPACSTHEKEHASEVAAAPEIALFNGRDLGGWTAFLEDPKARMEDVWSVENGAIRCKGTPVGYLRTTQDYTSYVLEVEWRFAPGSEGGNSGVLLRMSGPDKIWPKSIEAQLMNQNAGDIWNIDDFSMKVDPARTEGRRTRKLNPSTEVPLGQWNLYRISLRGRELRLVVNGVEQNVAQDCEIVPGKICLQSEGAAIEFRKIVLTPLAD